MISAPFFARSLVALVALVALSHTPPRTGRVRLHSVTLSSPAHGALVCRRSRLVRTSPASDPSTIVGF